MQVSETVGEARSQMKQGAGWLFRHARISIGRTGDDTFK
jgi:hypothetical protein